MYELGSIVRNGGVDYLTYMYKGKYYCCKVDNVGGSDDNRFGVDTLETLKSDCTDPGDRETQLNRYGVIAEKAKRGEIYNKMLLCKKKKGKLVWVSLKELQTCDLNTLLHIKVNYYKPNDESYMDKYEIAEVE